MIKYLIADGYVPKVSLVDCLTKNVQVNGKRMRVDVFRPIPFKKTWRMRAYDNEGWKLLDIAVNSLKDINYYLDIVTK